MLFAGAAMEAIEPSIKVLQKNLENRVQSRVSGEGELFVIPIRLRICHGETLYTSAAKPRLGTRQPPSPPGRESIATK